ncbi:hypothetical protein DFJ73DRAFT_623217 [Zopfochytrium polystomum]|nr:hypothetical protein DFJ73DRAFT_623217 [Zopfochytrium polystomum]
MQQPPQPPQLAQSQSQPQQLSVGAIAATPPPPTQSQQQPDTSKSTLWMGDLEPWMDENYIKQLWFSLGENVTVKMIRDKNTGTSAGYCFVDFGTHASALKQLANVQGYVIPGTNRIFKLNWASGGGLVDRKDAGPEFSLFVGDLGQEVNDQLLMATFQTHYESCKAAKVVTDPMTGMSRGYGFVRFSTELDQQRAMTEMQGQFCGSRPMRISTATPKNRSGIATIGMVGGLNSTLPGGLGPMGGTAGQQYNPYADPNNTTVFIGGLSPSVGDDELRSHFSQFGEIVYTKIPPGKGCGFVQYSHRHSAEIAIQQMNNALIGGSRVRLSWGKSQAALKGERLW